MQQLAQITANVYNIMMAQKIVDLFRIRMHPVWILLGDPSIGIEIAEKIISSNKVELDERDIGRFDLTKSTLDSFITFISLFPLKHRIAICTLANPESSLVSALLKRIEDLPDDTTIILLANTLPELILNRGITFTLVPEKNREVKSDIGDMLKLVLEEAIQSFAEKEYSIADLQNWLETALLKSMRQGVKEAIVSGYETWDKFLELRQWVETGQLGAGAALEMGLAMIFAAELRGADE